jgi:transposase
MPHHEDTTPTAWVGIDISKDTLDACLLPAHGRPCCRSFHNDTAGHAALLAWADAHAQGVSFCLESTGAYGTALAITLAQAGRNISVVNPARIKYAGLARGHGNKTDKADARLIAEYARERRPPAWHPAPAETREFQALVRRRDDLLLADRTHLESIPGVGAATAQAILAELPSVGQVPSAEQAAAYAGLASRQYQSGTMVRKRTRLSKAGNARLRKALYLQTLTAIRFNPLLRALYERLLGAGKAKMAAVADCMRKLLMIAYAVLKNRALLDPSWATN